MFSTVYSVLAAGVDVVVRERAGQQFIAMRELFAGAQDGSHEDSASPIVNEIRVAKPGEHRQNGP
ncbi:hypothetical protein BE11_07610 [Sorangium cellulosum]|nr:hypothetical protein BE11_07610 [Sorangium cellulosum]